jgi:hypothetical protein
MDVGDGQDVANEAHRAGPALAAITSVVTDGAAATVSFVPGYDGGSPLYSFAVTSSPGGITATSASSPITVTGLTAGVSYTFTVVAYSGAGASASSAVSEAITPTTVPGAPMVLSVAASSGQASVEFAAPLNSGGLPITSYTVTSSPGALSATGTSSPIAVTGLTNGAAYTFTVVATNANGDSLASPPSSSAIPTGVPGAPTAVSGTLSGTSALISFTAPVSNGGSPITSYRATSSPGGLTATAAASPITVPSLVAGISYSFTVVAVNALGTSESSGTSNLVVIPTTPGAPVIGAVVPGKAQASVSFTPPASDGGSPITSYTAISTPGNFTVSGPSSPLTVTGLANGTSYTFRVRCTTAFGTSAFSGASAAAVPKGPPGAPTAPAAAQTGTNGDRASVSFTAPAITGGSPITGYKVTANGTSITATGTASPIIITGLTLGTTYRFFVNAINAVGTSANSTLTANFIPTVKPNPPTITGVVSVLGGFVVSFSTPSNNGAAITSYNVAASPGSSTGSLAGATPSPITLSGLTAGTTYTLTATATNIRGTSSPSAPYTATAPIDSSQAMILLTYNVALDANIDVASGYSVAATGSQTDPFTGQTRVFAYAAGQAPASIQLPAAAVIVSYDAATSQYFSYRSSTIDPITLVEYDRHGQPMGSIPESTALYLVTSNHMLVHMLDGNFSDCNFSQGGSCTGVIRAPATQLPVTGTPATFTPLQTPSSWKF